MADYIITQDDFAGEGPAVIKDTKSLGLVSTLAASYISATGATGADGTAQDVLTVVVNPNTMIQVGDRVKVRCHWRGDIGASITGTIKLNGVTISSGTDSGGATDLIRDIELAYIDQAHATVLEIALSPAVGVNVVIAIPGFDWTASQNLTVSQNNVANNHNIVFLLTLDVFPKGVI